jgi:hypothetical protein
MKKPSKQRKAAQVKKSHRGTRKGKLIVGSKGRLRYRRG